MSKEIKQPTTFSQQVAKFEDKGITISDRPDCEKFLSRVNYYRLSGYVLPFIDRNTNQCLMSFETLKGIYDFDARLRSLIALAVETIEIHIRTQLAYFHAHTYGALGYIEASNYNKKHNYIEFMSHIQSCIDRNSRSPVVVHHKQLYMLKLMYPDRAEWNTRFYEPLVKLIEEYKDAIQLKHIGFPDDWRDRLRW